MVLLFLSSGTVMAQQAKVTSPMSKDLTEIPGKEVLMITVEYAPGGVDPIHRHNAHAFVYVLEGSIVMQVEVGVVLSDESLPCRLWETALRNDGTGRSPRG
jgi:hypothetical protein